MSLPRISIVTISFNQASFLEKTLQSVLDQRYPYLQYGVIDGGSTDGSVDIIERYRDQLDFAIIEPDDGQSDAINKGLRKLDGDVINWLNSDDTLAPGALHYVGQHFEKNTESHWLVGVSMAIDAAGRDLYPVNPVGPFNLSGALVRKTKFCIPQPSTFWRKEVIDQVGMLNLSYHHCMDLDLWVRFFAAGYEPAVVDETLANYRLHAASKSCSQAEGFVRTLIDIEKRYAHLLPWRQRLELYRQIGFQYRAHTIATAGDKLWRRVLRRPWWLASRQVRDALRSSGQSRDLSSEATSRREVFTNRDKGKAA